jgi:putative endonuclease
LSGEQTAANYLKSNGYKILTQNYRYQKEEGDIIAQKEGWLIAVEVKTRSTSAFGSPQEFLKPAQIQRIIVAVDYYVVSHKLDLEVRFDIIAIVATKDTSQIEHIKNAFYHF